MSDPKRFALVAAAWKCVLENTEKCLNGAAKAPAGRRSMMLEAAFVFLGAAQDRGHPEAAADAGLLYMNTFVYGPDGLYLARERWDKGIKINPNAVRARSLLRISNSWSLRLAYWIGQIIKG